METPLNNGAFSSASSLSSLPFIHSFTCHSFTQQTIIGYLELGPGAKLWACGENKTEAFQPAGWREGATSLLAPQSLIS